MASWRFETSQALVQGLEFSARQLLEGRALSGAVNRCEHSSSAVVLGLTSSSATSGSCANESSSSANSRASACSESFSSRCWTARLDSLSCVRRQYPASTGKGTSCWRLFTFLQSSATRDFRAASFCSCEDATLIVLRLAGMPDEERDARRGDCIEPRDLRRVFGEATEFDFELRRLRGALESKRPARLSRRAMLPRDCLRREGLEFNCTSRVSVQSQCHLQALTFCQLSIALARLILCISSSLGLSA